MLAQSPTLFFVSLYIYKFYLLFYSFVRKFLKKTTYMGPRYLKIKLPLLLSTLKKYGMY